MNDRQTIKAMIVGGGIGGLTAALALQRAGHDVTVVEQSTDVKRVWVGGGIHAWHNAMRAFQEIGIAREVERVGSLVNRVEFATGRGRIFATWPVADIAKRVGAPALGLSRADLLEVLGGALAEGTVRTGLAFVDYDQDASGVTVHFAGGHTERCDLLIGADGIRSAVRRQILGPIAPKEAGYAVWGGIVDFDRRKTPSGVFRVMSMGGNRFGFQRVGQEQLSWFGTANIGARDPDPPGGYKAFLLDTFRGWQEPIEEIIAATDEVVIRRRNMFALHPLKRWGEGRVTLLGDAAHAMTFDLGQGAGQAIEDAAVLARCLAGERDISTALRTYERQRMRRTAGMQKASWKIGQLNRWESALLCALRGQLVTFLLNGPVLRQHEQNMTI